LSVHTKQLSGSYLRHCGKSESAVISPVQLGGAADTRNNGSKLQTWVPVSQKKKKS